MTILKTVLALHSKCTILFPSSTAVYNHGRAGPEPILIDLIFHYHGLYSPCSEKEMWPNLKVAISPKLEMPHPPKLVCMHLTLTSTCMNFWADSNELYHACMDDSFSNFLTAHTYSFIYHYCVLYRIKNSCSTNNINVRRLVCKNYACTPDKLITRHQMGVLSPWLSPSFPILSNL